MIKLRPGAYRVVVLLMVFVAATMLTGGCKWMKKSVVAAEAIELTDPSLLSYAFQPSIILLGDSAYLKVILNNPDNQLVTMNCMPDEGTLTPNMQGGGGPFSTRFDTNGIQVAAGKVKRITVRCFFKLTATGVDLFTLAVPIFVTDSDTIEAAQRFMKSFSFFN